MTLTAAERTIADGDAWIPALEPWGLARVPGHSDTNPEWREEYFRWRDEIYVLRDRIHERAAEDPSFRAQEMAIAAQDIAYFCTMYLWLEEPRARDGEDTIKPFVNFAFQIRLLQQFAEVAASSRPEDVYVSKARGLGASWTVCEFAVWAWLFRPWRGKLVSRKEDLVDKPLDLDSLFGKIDMLLRWLPRWMLPDGYRKEDHRLKLLLKNPATGAQIAGESTTSKTGRGGRATYVVVDEAAFVPAFDDVFGTLAGTTDHRFAISSESFEESDSWWKAWHEQKATRPDLVWELDWWQNPYFTDEWFAAEKSRWHHDPEGFAREYERNPYAGFGAWVYPTARELPVVEATYDPSEMLLIGIDPGHADDTAIVWGHPRWHNGNRGIVWLDSYERNLAPVEFYAHLLTGVEPEPGDECWGLAISQRERDLMRFFRSIPWGSDRIRVFMDPAGAQKHSGISWFDLFTKKTVELRRRVADPEGAKPKPITPYYKSLRGTNNMMDERRYAARRLLAHSAFADSPGGRRIREALSNYRFSELTDKSTSEPRAIHNQHSHIATAVEYVSVYAGLGLADPPKRIPRERKLNVFRRKAA